MGRLGLLIHSTAGYVDPGWKGTLTLELCNVANLPIALYFGMRIGQISFFEMSSAVERPYGSKGLGSRYQGQSVPTASGAFRDFDANRRTAKGGPQLTTAPSVLELTRSASRARRTLDTGEYAHRVPIIDYRWSTGRLHLAADV